ncbi:molybdopterin-dependent oxidoreductase [Halomonas qaidamensis]|uniref:Molybdopterin-dependent oxidoreductase n=1 Tax=Halomonas qaidamensis TaxID=2866211 RepID=A0ABY6JN06_9GAMM|nr:molybdopterin-dependent oxidoreductase [Halomonas qaidamensis]UYV18000.1 molybdopterin-dependent oxidoreductase [Halomonas qaidamensis]
MNNIPFFGLQKYIWWLPSASLVFFATILLAAEVKPVPGTFAPSQDEAPILMMDTQEGRRFISRDDIESLPLYATSFQHFKGLHGSFAGVWLNDLLSAQNIDETATLRFIAHDDYSVFINLEDRLKRDYLLVTRLDGAPLTLTDFGPILLIVPAEAESVQAGTADMTHWIWSIRDIIVQ